MKDIVVTPKIKQMSLIISENVNSSLFNDDFYLNNLLIHLVCFHQ
jgi:hypothetical protein